MEPISMELLATRRTAHQGEYRMLYWRFYRRIRLVLDPLFCGKLGNPYVSYILINILHMILVIISTILPCWYREHHRFGIRNVVQIVTTVFSIVVLLLPNWITISLRIILWRQNISFQMIYDSLITGIPLPSDKLRDRQKILLQKEMATLSTFIRTGEIPKEKCGRCTRWLFVQILPMIELQDNPYMVESKKMDNAVAPFQIQTVWTKI